MNYFVIINGRQSGPHTLSELLAMPLTPDTPVWMEGSPDWVKAAECPELAAVFAREQQPVQYFAMLGSERIGPMSPDELVRCGVTPTTPVWTEGMPDWKNAQLVADFTPLFAGQYTTPPYHQYSPGQQQFDQPYGYNPVQNQAIPHTNWMPWAILGTILALCTSCIGVIFGVIGIVKASQANQHYASGNKTAGDMANSNAQVMTIIALVIDVIGLIVSGYIFGTGVGLSALL